MKESSPERFVRGKYQLSRYEPGSAATGRRLTEREVRAAYDPRVFAEMDEYLSAVLLKSRDAIEKALRERRKALGVTREQLASAASVDRRVVEAAETDAYVVEIRQLEHLAFVLGLDPALLSVDETAGADAALGVRLRRLERGEAVSQETRLGPRTVLRLSESASIISLQSRLQEWLDKPAAAVSFQPFSDYGPPAWRPGYQLAIHARDRLGLGLEPVVSMRALVEDRLGIPVIQMDLPRDITGATISSGGRRGIVLNIKGPNQNVWIRRTTLAHELAHILFDPDEELSSVRVDSYEQLERNARDGNYSADVVEQRANAFAVEFLAPQAAVKRIVPHPAQVSAEVIAEVMTTFGIGRAAARFHVGNSWWGQAELPPESSIHAKPADEQRAVEDFTLDYFPIEATPDRRRGRFAFLTAEAVEAGLITADTAAQYLACTETEFKDRLPYLLALT